MCEINERMTVFSMWFHIQFISFDKAIHLVLNQTFSKKCTFFFFLLFKIVNPCNYPLFLTLSHSPHRLPAPVVPLMESTAGFPRGLEADSRQSPCGLQSCVTPYIHIIQYLQTCIVLLFIRRSKEGYFHTHKSGKNNV